MARFFLFAALVLAGLGLGLPAHAHHSLAGYNSEINEEVVGTVLAYEWRNPHVIIRLRPAESASVDEEEMIFEGGDINRLMRLGWQSDSLGLGDIVLVTYNPARGDRARGHLVQVETARGETLSLIRFRRATQSPGGPSNAP